MSIPKYNEIQLSALELLKDREVKKLKNFELPLSKIFSLTEEELNVMYSSGNGPVFYDRISWALSYLNMAGLVHKPKRGYYQITDSGISILSTPDKLADYISRNITTKNNKTKTLDTTLNIDNATDNATPEEKIYDAFTKIKLSIYNEIIETILTKSPREFEKIVVALLQKMGYGGEIKDSGHVTQYSNDKGIDGIIKEDILGFGKIHIQAKRYKIENTIGREDLNKFVGALAGSQSNKGVFITTSSFKNTAIDYAENLNGINLVLIDGIQLAKYIYEYSYGMQTEQVLEIKQLDSDFWDTLEDDIVKV